jgi:hypothetical protein
MFRCDGCKTTGEPGPIPERWKQSSYWAKKDRLPEGWLEVIGKSNDRESFSVHYCTKCATELELLMRGMTVNETILEGEGVKPEPPAEKDVIKSNIIKSLSLIEFDTQSQANKVLVGLQEIEQTYGLITVADLFDLVSLPSQFTDNKYGWRRAELDKTFIVGLLDSSKYGLTLPAPVELDPAKKEN